MSKSLTESAAEILAASIGKNQEPKKDGGATVDELGGSDNQSKPEGDAIGVVAAAKTKVAPKPGQTAVPAEGKKSVKEDEIVDDEAIVVAEVDDEEELPELTEEEIDEYLDSLSEEELAELAALADESEEDETEVVSEAKEDDEDEDEDDEDEDEDDEDDEDDEKSKKNEEVEMTEEEIAEARKAAMKQLVSDNMGSCKEDIDALFSGEELSEEFKNKATTIFEAAVRARVESIVDKVAAENESIMESTIGEVEAMLTEQVDEYLNYVVEQWLEDNKLAVESGLRAEIAEDFMAGLKNLFVEHYIEVPEDKADLVEELAAQVAAKDEALAESTKTNAELTKALNESKAQESLRKICEGLTEVQVAKIKSLAEGVEFTTEGEYSQKLAVIRENYFPSGKKVSEAPVTLVETEAKEVSNTMDRYVNAITKITPKL